MTAPSVSVLAPIDLQIIGVSAPEFSVLISDFGLNSTWYQVFNGSISSGNYSYTYGLDTWIDQAAWDIVGNGTVTLRFYANDSLDHQNYEDVIVYKNIYEPIITILEPIPSSYFSSNPPDFLIEIEEINLNSTWYTVDAGAVNYSFTGNTTLDSNAWDTLVDGAVTITFFANNSEGNVGESSITIYKDSTNPAISINAPATNDDFTGPPSYEIDFTEQNLNKTWYSITDSKGATFNVTFNGVTGKIDEQIWNTLAIGDITIQFFIQDLAGNIDVAQIVIVRRSAPNLFGFDQPWIYLIIIAAAATMIIIAATRSNSRRSKKLLQEKEDEIRKLKEQREEITEGDITVSKEKHFCLVHKGPIEGYSFICPECGAYYCVNCVEAIKEIENTCWSCKAPLDKNKEIKPLERNEKENIVMMGKDDKKGKTATIGEKKGKKLKLQDEDEQKNEEI